MILKMFLDYSWRNEMELKLVMKLQICFWPPVNCFCRQFLSCIVLSTEWATKWKYKVQHIETAFVFLVPISFNLWCKSKSIQLQILRVVCLTPNQKTVIHGCHGCHFFTGPRFLWGPVYGSWSLYGTLWNFADVTLADDDTNSMLADDANRAICGRWLSFRWWSSPMWACRSSRGSARWWYRSCTEYWSWCAGELWSCWRQHMLLEHW